MSRTAGLGIGARMRRAVLPLGTVLVLIGVFEAVGVLGLVSRKYFPTVTSIARSLVDQAGTAVYWHSVLASLAGFGWGLLIAVGAGIPIGMVVGSSETAYRFVRFPIEFLRTIPSVAVLPLVVLLFGITLQMKIYLVAFVAFWPVVVQTIYGVHDVDPLARDSARCYGLGRLRQFLWVVLPSSAPYIATAVRIAAIAALGVDIAVEMIVGTSGIGNLMDSAQYASSGPALYALIVTTGVLGWLINATLHQVENRTLHWHVSRRRQVQP